jgi:hypothetical protein
MMSFDSAMAKHQSAWRVENILGSERGTQNGKQYDWILPKERWEEGLWAGIRGDGDTSLAAYLTKNKIQKHTGVNNLKSSWVLCANLYFPFGVTERARALLSDFLRAHVDSSIKSVDRIELEYAEDEGPLHPAQLLGEEGGSRGTGQTSPDIAFIVNGCAGLILTENKFVEHSFYPCSGRRLTGSTERPGNSTPARCESASTVVDSPASQCHQNEWDRRYWEHLQPVIRKEKLPFLRCCPAAKGGYQLFRQQALAEGIARSNKYALVVSAVAIDERNVALQSCLNTTGLADIHEWGQLFAGKARFAIFTHQQWVGWVRAHDEGGDWSDWLHYVEKRYDFPA